MANKIERFEVKTAASEVAEDQRTSCEFRKDPKSLKDWAVRNGTVNVYDDDELELLEEAGLSKDHQTLLNQIIVIRAQDAIRQTMRGSTDLETKQIAKRASAASKMSPEFRAKLEALLAEATKK